MKRIALPALCLLWAGIAIGISFIEAPAKFRAPSLTVAVGVDVGRHVFAASHAVQLALAGLTVAAAVWARLAGAARWLLAGVLVILAVQQWGLLPALDARALIVIAGGTPERGALHVGYIGLEVAKIAGLIALSVITLGSCRSAAGTARP